MAQCVYIILCILFQSPASVITRDTQSSEEIIVNLGEYSVKIRCPKCGEEMNTNTTTVIGTLTWVLVLILFLTLMWL